MAPNFNLNHLEGCKKPAGHPVSTEREDKGGLFQPGLLSQGLWGTVQVRGVRKEDKGGTRGKKVPTREPRVRRKGKLKVEEAERDTHFAVKRLSYLRK